MVEGGGRGSVGFREGHEMKPQVTGRVIIIKSSLQGGSYKALLVLLSLLFILQKCYQAMELSKHSRSLARSLFILPLYVAK